MPFDKNHPHGVLGASLAMGLRGIIPADEFKREDRYIVIKRKDLAKAPIHRQVDLSLAIEHLSNEIPVREYLVIESDWPEYETAWRMIERRMTAPSVDEKAPRPGREWWDRLCALPRHMFLLKPSGTGVQKLEQPSGNWIDVHDAQRLMDGAQSDINELRAEVERLTTESGKIRAINNLLDGINERAHDQIRRMVGRLQSAKLNPDCAICASLGDICVTCEEQAIQPQQMCSACQGYGVIGFTRGQTPESFEQGEYPCPECRPVEPAKTCAAKYGPHECNAARAEDRLFCAQHRSVDDRQRMGSDPITNEGLAFMMQRDGETQ